MRVVTSTSHLLVMVGLALISGAASAETPKAPSTVAKAGKITFCSDLSTPPLGFYDENNAVVGSDVDLGNEIAKRFGVKVEWINTPFDGIIPALQAKHCDAILSQLFDKPARREVVDMIDYMYSSQALMVMAGNPKKVNGLADLSGVKIAATNGTTIQSLVEEQNKTFQAAGKAPADITVFPKDTDALQSMQIGQVAVFGTTLESAGYYRLKAPGQFEVAGEPFGKILTGIAVRKGEPEMRDAIQKAVEAIRVDGTQLKILKKWNMEGDMLQGTP